MSCRMLQDVIDGKTYRNVALAFGVTRTVVERRVKAVALTLAKEVGIEGINPDGLISARRLRACRQEISAVLSRYQPLATQSKRIRQPLTYAAQKIRTRSPNPERDVALFYILLITGARPLEIARLEVRDYLYVDGSVRDESLMRSEVTINRQARPLFFASEKSKESIDSYLGVRIRCSHGVIGNADFRGLDPYSRLFLTDQGEPFNIVTYGKLGQNRFLCRGVLDAYSKIFRRADLTGISPLSVRRMVAIRLHAHGASDKQIGEILGISEKKSVRQLLSTRPKSLQVVMRGLL
jgi:integrase